MPALENLQRRAPISRPYAFDRVEVSGPVPFSILGVCWSQYASGPSLFMLADAAFELTGIHGFYGFTSARPRGFQKVEPLPMLGQDAAEAQRIAVAGRRIEALKEAKTFDTERLNESPLFDRRLF